MGVPNKLQGHFLPHLPDISGKNLRQINQVVADPKQPEKSACINTLPSAFEKGFQYSILQNTPAQKAVQSIQFTSAPSGGIVFVIILRTGSMIAELTMMVVMPQTAKTQINTLTKYSILVIRQSYLQSILNEVVLPCDFLKIYLWQQTNLLSLYQPIHALQ